MSRRTLPFWTFFVAAIGAVLPVANAHLTGQVARPSGLIALRGGTILTVTQGTIPNGTIVLRDGKYRRGRRERDDPGQRRGDRRLG